MVQYYKEKNFVFKLKDLVSTEEFCIWTAYGKQVTDQDLMNQFGVVCQFPIKTGSLPGVDKVPRDVQTVMKYMKSADFTAQYPFLSKSTTFVRDVLIRGDEFRYRFKKSCNDKLNVMLSLQPGVVPDKAFKQTFDKNKPGIQMYELAVATDDEYNNQIIPPSATPPPVAPVVPVANPQPTTPVTVPIGGLNAGETTILTKIKGLKTKLDKDKFIHIMVKNLAKKEFGGLTAEQASQRALVLFENHY